MFVKDVNMIERMELKIKQIRNKLITYNFEFFKVKSNFVAEHFIFNVMMSTFFWQTLLFYKLEIILKYNENIWNSVTTDIFYLIRCCHSKPEMYSWFCLCFKFFRIYLTRTNLLL